MGHDEVGQVAPPFFSMATMVFLFVAGLELYFESDFVHFKANPKKPYKLTGCSVSSCLLRRGSGDPESQRDFP